MKSSEILNQRISALEEQISFGQNKPMNLMETAEYLGLSPSYIYKLTYKKIIPHYKPTGKRVYFFKKEIDEWITSNEERSSTCLAQVEAGVKNEDNFDALAVMKNGVSNHLAIKSPQQIEMKVEKKGNK